jgi:hypothetical protein
VQKGQVTAAFQQWLPHEGWIKIVLPTEQLMGQGGIAKMFGAGAAIHDPLLFKQFVVSSIDRFHKAGKLRTEYEQCGWKGNDFLWGTTLYRGPNKTTVVGTPGLQTRAQWLKPTKGALLSTWRDAVKQLFTQRGYEPHCLAILASFAAPFMRFNSDNEGGAILSLVSMQTATGKTVALDAAASVWGQHRGTTLTEIDTPVSRAITLGELSNLPVIYDELAGRNPEFCRDFVMMFTNGRDKMRGTSEGTVRHVAAQWQTVLITASNQSLVEALVAAGGSEAPSVRVFEVIASRGDPVAHGTVERLKKVFWANSGAAGERYLEYITRPDVAPQLPQWALDATELIWKQSKLPQDYRFWVRLFAGCALAARVLEHLEILPFAPMKVVEWAMSQAQDMSRGLMPAQGTAQSAGMIGSFLSEHINAMLVVQHAASGRGMQPLLVKPVGGVVAVRYEVAPGRIYVALSMLKTWGNKKGIHLREMLNMLEADHVLLDRQRLITLGAGTEYPTGQTSCIVLDANHPLLSGSVRLVEKEERKVG